IVAWRKKTRLPARRSPAASAMLRNTYEAVEPQFRRLVADHLGVGLERLSTDVSMRDELAADSLDLVELTMVIEAEFAIAMPDRILDAVRSYGDLVNATVDLIAARHEAEAGGAEAPHHMKSRLEPAAGESSG